MVRNKIYLGDAYEKLKEFPSQSVDCCITSPPYWGLRDYHTGYWVGGEAGCKHMFLGAGNSTCSLCNAKYIDLQIGIEKTPEKYTARIISMLAEVYRVLKPHGSLWLNLGDSYCSTAPGSMGMGSVNWHKNPDVANARKNYRNKTRFGLKPKDMVGIPWRVAFGLQGFALVPFYHLREARQMIWQAMELQDWEKVKEVSNLLRIYDLVDDLQKQGWYIRQDIIWQKKNAMPESVKDRCSRSHEYVFLLTKSKKYYFDHVAIMEDAISSTNSGWSPDTGKRNRRSVWEINTRPFADSHFATFPPELPKMVLSAAVSYKGYCNHCGKPYVRVYEKLHDTSHDGKTGSQYDIKSTGRLAQLHQQSRENGKEYASKIITKGWKQSCKCEQATPVPGLVLDTFMGSGTTAEVAKEMQLDFVGIELNQANIAMADNRLQSRFGLFHESVIV